MSKKPIYEKPRPKSLGKPKKLSSSQKSKAKSMAKSAGRPYPNMVDNIRAANMEMGGIIDARDRSENYKEGGKVSPAWQRKEGKNPSGGLNAKGRASYKKETGGTLKAPVKSGDNPRRASFLARMGNMAGPERKNGEPTRLLKSLQAWGASSKADAKAKAKAISKRNKGKK
jgi:hypothetical protein